MISIAAGGNFKLDKLIDLTSFSALSNIPLNWPKSVDTYAKMSESRGQHLLVGLRNGTILEVPLAAQESESQEPRILQQSHFEGETWGLAVTEDDKIITCGDDNRIMMFDAETKQFVKGGKISDKKMKDPTRKSNASTASQMPPNKQARAVTYSKKHNHLILCNNLGKVSIRSLDDFEKKPQKALKHAKSWCEVACYSPCENYLAVGSHDDHLYVYSVDPETHEYALLTTDHKHSSWINAIDWTADSKEIRSSSGDYEVLYFDVEGKKFDPHGSETAKDKVWATNSVKYGEDRAGVQPSGEDRTHINDVNSRDGVLLSGDDFGLVNVFKWPSPALKESRSFAAHSEHVVRVAFGKNFVFSIGGQDKALVQWRLEQNLQ